MSDGKLPPVDSLIDSPPKYLSREEEAEQVRHSKERRAKEIDEHIKALPSQFYRDDYIETNGDRPVTIKFLGRALATLAKDLVRGSTELLLAECDKLEELVIFQRNRCRVLEAEVAALKSGAASRGLNLRGTYIPAASYSRLDVVALDGGSFIARRDNPGPCPGDGWQLLVQRGKPGRDGKHPSKR